MDNNKQIEEVTEKSEKSKIVAALIGFFLGPIVFFYIGKKKLGIILLIWGAFAVLCTDIISDKVGFCMAAPVGILSLVMSVMAIMGKLKDSHGKPIK